jgi:hypothetical protein
MTTATNKIIFRMSSYAWALTAACIISPAIESAHAAEQPAGKIEFARGLATAHRDNQPARILGEGQSFYTGDVLSTSGKSFAVIRLQDGSKFTLRPETQFSVASIDARQDANAGVLLRLFKGGVRAATGYISKYNKNGYRLETPVATMGIRGTEFDARLCSGDCGNEEVVPPAARIVYLRGRLAVRTPAGANQTAKLGSYINVGETLKTEQGAMAVIVFSDNSRVTLQPDSELALQRYRYDKKSPQGNESLLQLVRGGLRVVTGLIGKVSPQAYKVSTPVATMGVRGTGFDLLCKGQCGNPKQAQRLPWLQHLLAWTVSPAIAESVPAHGLYAYVWSGEIDVFTQDKSYSIKENSAAFLTGNAPPIMLPEPPQFLRDNPFPKPDSIKVEPEQEFGQDKPDTGLYVSVYAGEVAVEDVRLQQGEASYTNDQQQQTARLDSIPLFMLRDVFPKPDEFDQRVFRLLNVLESPADKFECEVQ